MILQKCQVPEDQHKRRMGIHRAYGEMLKHAVRCHDFSVHENAVADKPSGDFIPMAYMYPDTSFGAANTVEKAGCVCFTSYYLLQKYDEELEMTFLEWVDEVVRQGYRMWNFSKYPKITFSSPKVDIHEAKERFKGVVDLEDCDTIEELILRLGEPSGIGGSFFLMDNVIAALTCSKVVEETRLVTVRDILFNLKNGFWVPIRVNNALYRNDPSHQGGHYVTLFGVEGTTALVWDSDSGEVRVPFERLMEAAIENEGLIAAWNIIGCAKK